MQVKENHIYNRLFTKEKIVAYLQNRLGSEERSLFEAQLKDDPFLEDAMEGYKMLPAADIHVFVDAICKDLDLVSNKNRRRFISLQTRPMAIAALFLIFIGISWFAVWFMNKSAADQQIAQTEKIQDQENIPDQLLPTDNDDKISPDRMDIRIEKSQSENSEPTSDNNRDYRKETLSENKAVTETLEITDDRKQNEAETKDAEETRAADINTVTAHNSYDDAEAPAANSGVADAPKTEDQIMNENITLEKADVKKGKVSKNADKDITLSGTTANTSYADLNDESVYLIADEMPRYEGGETAMNTFISRNLHISDSIDNSHEQEVIVKFIVDKNGKVRDASIVKGISTDIDAEVLRVISSMPGWIAGKQNGSAVNVSVTLPVKIDF